MSQLRTALAALLLLSACSGSPFEDSTGGTDGGTGGGTGGGTDGGIDSDRVLPPGTASPKATSSIVRYEATGDDSTDGNSGNGYVTKVSYDRKTDTFSVDGLAFDGDNTYARGSKVGSLGKVAVYEGKPSIPDGFSGTSIDQIQHRALYGVSSDGQVEFAIVRTGGYVDYGFGGFIYQRNGSVKLPSEGTDTAEYRGQARYKGKFASLRDFKARSGLEYGRADMTMDIDYDDFNDGNGVKGRIYNRKIYDINGKDITEDVVAALSAESNLKQDELPEIRFRVQQGVMDDNGEIVGTVSSSYYNGEGAIEGFEEGNYYAIVEGKDADQVVGVVVVEGDDPRWSGVTTRETGGFILKRKKASTN